jgi:hypothetical protein
MEPKEHISSHRAMTMLRKSNSEAKVVSVHMVARLINMADWHNLVYGD